MADTRDSHGRFRKGAPTNNPKGRPTKLSKVEFGDFELFKNTTVEVDAPNGRKRILTREAAIQERLYASAMKGNVQAQIFLTRKFEQSKEALVEAEALLNQIQKKLQGEAREPTDDEAAAMRLARLALNIDPRPDWKIKKQRPSRAKKTATPASRPELRSIWIEPPPPAKPAKRAK